MAAKKENSTSDQSEFTVKSVSNEARGLVEKAGLGLRGKSFDTGLDFDDYSTPEKHIQRTLEAEQPYIKEHLVFEAAHIIVRNIGYGYLTEIFDHYDLNLNGLVTASYKENEEEFESQFGQLRESASQEAQKFLDKFDKRAIRSTLAVLQGELNKESLEKSVKLAKALGRFAEEIIDEPEVLTFAAL